ncbi:MAG: transcription termination/antitermination protein NusG [Gemmataceae bacterium]
MPDELPDTESVATPTDESISSATEAVRVATKTPDVSAALPETPEAAIPPPALASSESEMPEPEPDAPEPEATAPAIADDSAPEPILAERTPPEAGVPPPGEEVEATGQEDAPSPAAAESAPEADEPAPTKTRKEKTKKEAAKSKTPEADEPPSATPKEPAEPDSAAPADNKQWYVVKVQSGREDSIKEAIERRVKIEGLEEFFGQIIVPVERVTEMRRGQRVVKEKKLYPGYLMVNVEYNDRILYLFRETSGVGDFVGGSVHHAPPPMAPADVERMLRKQGSKEVHERPSTIKPAFDKGDQVKVKDGMFAGMEGEVKDILEAKNSVKVELTIFGRPVPVELEYWQVEHA